jgi:hypothetical protein
MKQIITKLAIRWICKELRNDKKWWITYKANIAMSMYDVLSHMFSLEADKEHLYDLCNKGAENFLQLWTKP